MRWRELSSYLLTTRDHNLSGGMYEGIAVIRTMASGGSPTGASSSWGWRVTGQDEPPYLKGAPGRAGAPAAGHRDRRYGPRCALTLTDIVSSGLSPVGLVRRRFAVASAYSSVRSSHTSMPSFSARRIFFPS